MIVFLDIDGVLVISKDQKTQYSEEYHWVFNSKSVRALNHLCEQTKAKIVISSAWRRCYPFWELKNILIKEGVKAEIIGVTGAFSPYYRGIEILDWMKAHKYTGEYLIIDDNIGDISPFHPVAHILHIKNGFDRSGLTMIRVNNYLRGKHV